MCACPFAGGACGGEGGGGTEYVLLPQLAALAEAVW
jgi:hypothetical protein